MRRKEKNVFIMAQYFLLVALFIFGLLTIIGTGGGGGGDGGSNGSSSAETGTFMDSPVAGLAYETDSQSGITDTNGHFHYFEGEMITFRLGDTILGQSVTAKSLITPIDLVPGAIDVTNSTVTNICVLLQSLDDDGNIDDGISIVSEVRSAMEGVTINFNQSTTAFINDGDVQDLFADLEQTLITPQEAQEHLRNTMRGFSPFTLTGDWNLIQPGINEETMTLMQSGNILSGTTTDGGSISGTFDENIREIDINIAYGNGYTCWFEMTISGDSLYGNFYDSEGQSGEAGATRVGSYDVLYFQTDVAGTWSGTVIFPEEAPMESVNVEFTVDNNGWMTSMTGSAGYDFRGGGISISSNGFCQISYKQFDNLGNSEGVVLTGQMNNEKTIIYLDSSIEPWEWQISGSFTKQ